MIGVHALKEIAEKIVPRKYLRVWGMYFLRTLTVFDSGTARECTCCKKTFSKFKSYGVKARFDVLCPWCLSLERHRLLWVYLEEKTNTYTEPVKMIHFAPEHQFQERFKKEPNIDYISADIDMPTAMVKEDITNISFPDNTFDILICNHVLEHIPDDRKAMSEIFRILKPGGWAILQTPLSGTDTTDEDPTLTDPKEMERRFGQNDHVRIYGTDKKERLESVGFNVTADDYVQHFPKEVAERHRFDLTEYIYYCVKPK